MSRNYFCQVQDFLSGPWALVARMGRKNQLSLALKPPHFRPEVFSGRTGNNAFHHANPSRRFFVFQ
jgi:hypothetical protein